MGSAVCPSCGRTVRTVVPKGGDGSAKVYVRHYSKSDWPALRCPRSRAIVSHSGGSSTEDDG